MFNIFFA